MKSLNLAIVLMLSLMLLGCFSRDDDYFDRNVRLTITDAVTFDAKKEYKVGDTLVFELKFSRYLEESGYSTLLDVYETTDSKQFGYNFGISKFSGFSNSFERINIDQQYILGARTEEDYSTYYGGSMAAILDAEEKEYRSKVGIILVDTGRFKVDVNSVSLNSDYGYERDRVNVAIDHIQTTENESEAEFTVSEN